MYAACVIIFPFKQTVFQVSSCINRTQCIPVLILAEHLCIKIEIGTVFWWLQYTRVIQKRLYLPIHNFVNIKVGHLKFATFVVLRLSFTLMVNPFLIPSLLGDPYMIKAGQRFWTTKRGNATEINVLVLLVSLIHYDK